MTDLIAEMLSEESVALVGATDNREKYGYRIFLDLVHKGYTVYPINPRLDTLEGQICYADLDDLPDTPGIVCFVVPPSVTEKLIPRAVEIGARYIWIQPGAESESAISACESQNMPCVHHQCIMVQSRSHTE